jgi:hypothetical protein
MNAGSSSMHAAVAAAACMHSGTIGSKGRNRTRAVRGRTQRFDFDCNLVVTGRDAKINNTDT